MRARFDRIFCRRTGFATLDRLLLRLHANKAELLAVLERPEIPLHTNGSERDIRCHVIKRKISGGTRSDAGRECRDAFLGLSQNRPNSASLSGIISVPGSDQPLTGCRPLPPRTHPLPRTTRFNLLARVLPHLRVIAYNILK